jgi:hypothetical protein
MVMDLFYVWNLDYITETFRNLGDGGFVGCNYLNLNETYVKKKKIFELL